MSSYNKIVDIIRVNDINYLRLESIKSTGTQYIDTGIKASSRCRIDSQFELGDSGIGSGYWSALYGCMNSLSDGDALGVTFRIKSVTVTTQGNFELWSYYGDKEFTNTTVPEVVTDNRTPLLFWTGDRQRFVFNTADTKVTQYENDEGGGGALYYTQGHHHANISYKKYPQYPWHFYDVTDFTTAGNIYIFAFNKNGTPDYMGQNGEISCYGFDMYDRDLNPLIKLVPVERQSDGTIGMLDILTGTFLTNQGTGSFIKGEYIYVTKINEGCYQFTGINAYEELEYIHFPDWDTSEYPAPMTIQHVLSQPFVDIDYHADGSSSVEVKYKVSQDIRGSSKLNGQCIYHTCDISWTTQGFGLYGYQGSTGTWYVNFKDDEKSLAGGYVSWDKAEDGGPMVVQVNRWNGTTGTHCVHKNDDDTSYGAFSKTINNQKWHHRRSIRIGEALLENAVATSTANFYKLWGSEIYYLKLYKIIDGVDTLDAWLVPARRLYDGVCGFYDKVRNRFFGPSWDDWYTKETGTKIYHSRMLEGGPSVGNYITGPVTFNDASYLEFKSTSTGYFELPYKVNNKTKIECDISFTSAGLSVESNPIFLGHTNFNFLESSTDAFGVSIYEGDLISFHGSHFVDAGEGSASSIFTQANKIYKLCKDSNKLYIDGVLKVTNTAETFTAENNLIIGKASNINTNGIKYHRIKVYDNNVLLYDLVPVSMNDVVCGFVDKINNVFYKYTGGDDTMFTGVSKRITRIRDEKTGSSIYFSNDTTPLMSTHPSMSESTPEEDSIDYHEEP